MLITADDGSAQYKSSTITVPNSRLPIACQLDTVTVVLSIFFYVDSIDSCSTRLCTRFPSIVRFILLSHLNGLWLIVSGWISMNSVNSKLNPMFRIEWNPTKLPNVPSQDRGDRTSHERFKRIDGLAFILSNIPITTFGLKREREPHVNFQGLPMFNRADIKLIRCLIWLECELIVKKLSIS